MKILIVSQHYYPEQFRINDIAQSLVQSGHSVTVLTGLPNYPSGKITQSYRWFRKRHEWLEGVEIHRVPIIARGKRSLIQLGLNYLSFAFFGSLKTLFWNERFDAIYVFQVSPVTMILPAVVMKSRFKTPILVHCLDQWPISILTGPLSKEGMAYKLLHSVSQYLYQKADRILISSPSFKEYFERELNITAKDKGLFFWPSYAEDGYKDTEAQPNQIFDLVYAGNIGPALSVETIVKAAVILKNQTNIHFHIVGDGLSLDACEQIAKENQLKNITFHGSFEVKDMKRFYDLADAFLITMVDNEIVNHTLPAKLQSYMLAGKPIIGAISGDVKDLIQEADCGLSCESEDAEGLSRLILNAYEHPELWSTWGKNAQSYYQKHFDKRVALQNLQKILEEMVSGG